MICLIHLSTHTDWLKWFSLQHFSNHRYGTWVLIFSFILQIMFPFHVLTQTKIRIPISSFFDSSHFFRCHIFVSFLHLPESGSAWIFWHKFLIRVNNNKWVRMQKGKHLYFSKIKIWFYIFLLLLTKYIKTRCFFYQNLRWLFNYVYYAC